MKQIENCIGPNSLWFIEQNNELAVSFCRFIVNDKRHAGKSDQKG